METVHFRETLASDNFFGMVISNMCIFFQRSIYPRTAAAGGKLLCNDGGGDPLQALLEGALGQQAACQL